MSEEMNDVDLNKVAELLTDEIKVLGKCSMRFTQPEDIRKIASASERIGIATKLVLKRVVRIEDYLQIPENFE